MKISSSLALFPTGGLGIEGLHSILEGQISYYTGLMSAYNSNKLTTGYAPFKRFLTRTSICVAVMLSKFNIYM